MAAPRAPREPAATAERPIVASVELKLPPGEDAAALRRFVTVAPGAPLDRRELRRTVQLLYGSGRFANVVARTAPAAGGVALVLECLARQTVASVAVEAGPRPALDEERVRRAAGLAPGDELWAGRLEDAAARARAFYARHGYRSATVVARAEGEGAARVVLAVAEGPPTRVASLAFSGAPGLAPERLADGLASQPGAVLDLDLLEADAREVRARLKRAGWLRARVGAAVVSGEPAAAVTIPVEAGGRVAVRFAGATAFPPADLRAVLALEDEQALDGTALALTADRLRGYYVARGFAAARVTVREEAAGGGSALVFQVEEGRRYRVTEVTFPGAAGKSADWLRERLDEALDQLAPQDPGGAQADAARLARAAGSPAVVRAPPLVEPRQAWNPPLWDEAALRLVELYRADGYLDAAYEGARATLDARAGTVAVELRLREGVRTVVEAVVFTGQRALPADALAAAARIAPGDPLAYEALEATRAALLARYARSGYLYARVREEEELSQDRRRGTVRFTIEEGPCVRVGAVVVAGARRTRDDVVRETLALRPGDVYDPDAASRSQTALLRLGVFRSVGLRLADPELPAPVKDVTVEVSERPWRTLSPGAGFSLANGPRAFVELTEPNLLGRALELSARAKVNYPLTVFRRDLEQTPPADRFEGRLDVGLHDPRVHLLGLPAGGRVDGILERLHRPAYDLARGSTILGLDLPATSRVTLSLQYELEVDHIIRKADTTLPITRADLERLRLPEGVTTLQSLRPVLAIDYRDDSVHPRRGWLATGTADYSHSIGGLLGVLPRSDSYTHMLRLSGSVSGYLPLGASVLAVSVRGGRVLPLDRDSQTIGPKRFFLGGASSMRGYGEDEMIPEDVRGNYLDQVRACQSSLSGFACSPTARAIAAGQFLASEGGESFANAKAELRFPLRESVEMGLFADLGNLWLDPRVGSVTDLRVNVGAGLRFLTPIGPAVLDLGVNPAPDQRLGEVWVAPHFSIGMF
ncbi:outer membrane protein assembly factor [Anaeromyxobacter diazotrophicus]|uniref:POTRA domain-containing protein n=1 Tax=Anaeromyxobacter diazotrophicus TaxID=2590199 RepID=A0A7I9VH05_9BACT|nr:outer membrane protein assembly factor [Anaeromyxobacter diazotrophicus]GEJ55625.1 hypothetical protein AMYX_03660 [Anaeromyxobacter diazotrophicus]